MGIIGGRHNLGHSVIPQHENVRIDPITQYEPESVHIERLDSILDSKKFNVPVMKIDVEGFECNVIDGMGSILTDSVHIIHAEVFGDDLERFSCSSDDYMKKLQAANFDITPLSICIQI